MARVATWFTVASLLGGLVSGAGPVEAETVGQVFRRVNASVVVVRTRERDIGQQSGASTPTVAGLGSGVVIDSRGHVLTAAHVVQMVDEITVEFLDGHVSPARVIGSEPEADLALLELEKPPSGMQVAVLGDSDAVEVGDQVFIVGAPYGIGHTLTVGHISARHKPNTVYSGMSLAEFLQTDAAINHGNSGGPMFSLRGEIVGIVSHIISKSGGFEGLGFVVTCSVTRRRAADVRSALRSDTDMPVTKDRYEGKSGNTQGERNENSPAVNATTTPTGSFMGDTRSAGPNAPRSSWP